jgi:radical SAM superfamily enzyme YgiQ (UPF0313 family)
MLERLRQYHDAHDLRICLAYAFDFRTRMLPYWYADKRMAPCSVRTLADALYAAGFKHLRVVLQQWTPRFKPSLSEIDGRPIDLLLVSAMQVHAEPAYGLIRDAHTLGDKRPLILAGGPKAIYEPCDYFELGPKPGIGADCVVTGETFVMLELMETILAHRRRGEPIRAAYERTRHDGALQSVPGLAYLHPEATPDRPYAVNTGIQRLLRDLDEMPIPDAGFRLLERPHWGRRLKNKPFSAHLVKWRSPLASIITTQGCKFNCSYCPIPAVNQRTWRHKSPERLVAEIKHIYENFGIRSFFSTDDNFFNSRDTVVSLMTALDNARTDSGLPLGKRVRFYTEATEFDVYKNRDILPLCRRAGLRGIWFGIEDINGELVNKGQSAGKTAELFELLHRVGIQPMAMMIHNDEQPFRSPPGTLTGLLNQARYLFDKGAISYQCTYLGPAVGARNLEEAIESKTLFMSVGGKPIPQAFYDGNHVVASRHAKPWKRQMEVVRAYAAFYNPINTIRSLFRLRRGSVSPKRIVFQFVGQIGLLMTIPKLLGWAWRMRRGPIEIYQGMLPPRIPMISPDTGEEINWAVRHLPSPGFNNFAAAATRTVAQRVPEERAGIFALPVVAAH